MPDLHCVHAQALVGERWRKILVMIYRLGFWTGPVPADDESACTDLHTRIFAAQRRRRESGLRPPPVPEMRRFVDAVLAELPERTEDEACPWSDRDVAGAATAGVFLPLLSGPHRRAIALLTQIAHEHDLHGFDLAAHRILNMSDVYWVEDAPSTDAVLAVDPSTVLADLSASRSRICRGPEVARQRLASSSDGLQEPTVEAALGAAS